MMVFWQPVTNLRDYGTNNPPGMTFFCCLLTLALSFICLGSYSYTHTLPNPDTKKDWNHLLSSLAQHHLCVKNTSSVQQLTTISSPKDQNLQKENSLNPATAPVHVAYLHLQVPLTLTANSEGSSQRDVSLRTNFSASQLQLEGNDIFSLTIDFVVKNNGFACLTISAPIQLLSLSPLPPTCPQTVKNLQEVYVEARKEMPPEQNCYSLQSRHDPTLQVMLTKEDQFVAVQHLLEVSVVLLAICLILCISVSLTHYQAQRHYWKEQHHQNEPLIDD